MRPAATRRPSGWPSASARFRPWQSGSRPPAKYARSRAASTSSDKLRRRSRRVQMRGGDRRPGARRSLSTLSPPVEGANEADGPLSAACACDADDAVEGRLRHIQRARAVEHDAPGVTQVAGNDADLAGRRDPKDLLDLKAAGDEDAAVRPHSEARSMVVSGRQPRDETKIAVGSESEHLPDDAQDDKIVPGRRHADQPPR